MQFKIENENGFTISKLIGELFITQAKLEALTSILITEENELQIKLATKTKYIEILRKFNEDYPNVIDDFDKTIKQIIDLD